MKVPSEKAIVKAILAYLNSLPGCVARKRWGGGYGVAGDPDITGCIRGQHFEFEVKRPGAHLTSLQAQRLAEWRGAGAVAAVVTGVSDIREVFRQHGLSAGLAHPHDRRHHYHDCREDVHQAAYDDQQ